jgi:hypothetical protein
LNEADQKDKKPYHLLVSSARQNKIHGMRRLITDQRFCREMQTAEQHKKAGMPVTASPPGFKPSA